MTSKTILVIGSHGQLGRELQVAAKLTPEHTWIFTHRETLDVTCHSDVQTMMTEKSPSIVINCTAFTAVDKAEKDTMSANAINHLAVKNLAESAKINAACLIHVSTDYVFNGNNHKAYVESDSTDPQGAYGQTKLDGENAFKESGAKGITIRTSWVYSAFGNNFVKTMSRLGHDKDNLNVVVDQIGSPTWAADLAQAIVQICQSDRLETFQGDIFHYSNEGVCSWYDFAREIMAMADIDCQVNAINSIDYPTPAVRPHFSVLDKSKIKSTFNLSIPHWRQSLALALVQFAKEV